MNIDHQVCVVVCTKYLRAAIHAVKHVPVTVDNLGLCVGQTLLFINFRAIIAFIDDREQRELWEGLVYAAAMFVVAIFQTLVLQQYFKIVMVTGLRIRTAVLGIVYKKVQLI